MATKKPVAVKRVLRVKDSKGFFKVELPAGAKLTMGPAFPQAKKDGSYNGEREYALRVYMGTKENIIACFLGIRDFRDDTVSVWREVVQEAGKTMWKSDEGGYKVEHEVKQERRLELEGAVEKL